MTTNQAARPIIEVWNDGLTHFDLYDEQALVLEQLSEIIMGPQRIINRERVVVTCCERLPSGRWAARGYFIPKD